MSPVGACHVELVHQLSAKAACTINVSYGCSSSRQMWTHAGCRGRFRCGETSAAAKLLQCSSHGQEERINCSCVKCNAEYQPMEDPATNRALRAPNTSSSMTGVLCAAPRAPATCLQPLPCHANPSRSPASPALHATAGTGCVDNGATLSYGSWDINAPGNTNMGACRTECARTAGCTHYTFSDADLACAEELRAHVTGRCTLCGACTLRHRQHSAAWHKGFVSRSLHAHARPAPHISRAAHAGLIANHIGGHDTRAPRPTAALIISGCDQRYERAAAVARRAGLLPSWLPAVFPPNVARTDRACAWPSTVEQNLLMAHRNAWSIIAATATPMLVLEDDIELASTSEQLHADLRRCDGAKAEAPLSRAVGSKTGNRTSASCELLFVGFVDAHWATHALYVTPHAARKLLRASASRCSGPADHHTHRMCLGEGRSWHADHHLGPHCFGPVGFSSEPHAEEVAGIGQLRPPELYGVGHFVQNRTLGNYIHSQNAVTGRFGALGAVGSASASGERHSSGDNC